MRARSVVSCVKVNGLVVFNLNFASSPWFSMKKVFAAALSTNAMPLESADCCTTRVPSVVSDVVPIATVPLESMRMRSVVATSSVESLVLKTKSPFV